MAKYSKNIEDIKSAVKENQLVCDKNNAYYITYNRDQDKFLLFVEVIIILLAYLILIKKLIKKKLIWVNQKVIGLYIQ